MIETKRANKNKKTTTTDLLNIATKDKHGALAFNNAGSVAVSAVRALTLRGYLFPCVSFWIVGEQGIAQGVCPIGSTTPQVNALIVRDTRVTIAEIRCQQVLMIFDLWSRSPPPPERQRVQGIDVYGIIELQVVDGGLLTVTAERVNVLANSRGCLVNSTRTFTIVEVYYPMHI